MNFGLVGSGGREHAIAVALCKQSERDHLFVFSNSVNSGIEHLSQGYCVGSLTDFDSMIAFFKEKAVEFVVVGPELPLINGVVDALRENGIPSIGPNKIQAQIEGSKSFMRDLLENHVGWGSPKWRVVKDTAEARSFIAEIGEIVVKPIGLTGGKGVQVMGVHLTSIEETIKLIADLIHTDGEVLLEERLVGEEFSRIVFISDGLIIPMPVAQDFKYAFEGDTGKMTGGMGSYTMAGGSMPFLEDKDLEMADQLMQEVVVALEKISGAPYRGFLYGQFMATRNGICVIEFNSRLGDPEAINEMALLDCDAVQAFFDIAHGNLKEDEIKFSDQASLCKYLVPAGYPDEKQDHLIFSLDEDRIRKAGFDIRYSSVVKENGQWRTLGSRTIAVVGMGDTPGNLSDRLEELLKEIEPNGLRHRHDIGKTTTLQQKVDRMSAIRSGRL